MAKHFMTILSKRKMSFIFFKNVVLVIYYPEIRKNILDQNAKILKTIITKQHIDSISQISLLLDKYPELVNYKLDHQTGKTPLHFAALNYKNTITNFLLEKVLTQIH